MGIGKDKEGRREVGKDKGGKEGGGGGGWMEGGCSDRCTAVRGPAGGCSLQWRCHHWLSTGGCWTHCPPGSRLLPGLLVLTLGRRRQAVCLRGEDTRLDADRQTHRQTHRQTGRQTHRQTHRQTERQTHRQTGRQTHRQTDRQTDRQRQTHRQTGRQTDRQTGRQTQARDADLETEAD